MQAISIDMSNYVTVRHTVPWLQKFQSLTELFKIGYMFILVAWNHIKITCDWASENSPSNGSGPSAGLYASIGRTVWHTNIVCLNQQGHTLNSAPPHTHTHRLTQTTHTTLCVSCCTHTSSPPAEPISNIVKTAMLFLLFSLSLGLTRLDWMRHQTA